MQQQQELESNRQVSEKQAYEPSPLPKLPVRDVVIHLMCSNGKHLDDTSIFLQRKLDWRKYKINSVRISCDSHPYISGLWFNYKPMDPKSKLPKVAGHKMESRYYHKNHRSKVLELSDDEYIVKVILRRGMILDSIGFQTNKGRSVYLGGEGGNPLEINLPEGYTMGPVSTSAGGYFNGVQFDYVSWYDHKFNQQQKSFVLDESDSLFMNYAARYLSCRQVIRNFRVCKKWANFRTYSELFWYKCLETYEKGLIAYLHQLAKKYQIEALHKILVNYQIRTVQIINRLEPTEPFHLAFWSFPQKQFLITVGVQYLNATFEFDDCRLVAMIDRQPENEPEIWQSRLVNEEAMKTAGYKTHYLCRQLTFYVSNKEKAMETIKKIHFSVRAHSTWYDAYLVEVKETYLLMAPVFKEDLVLGNFDEVGEGLYLNHRNKPPCKKNM